MAKVGRFRNLQKKTKKKITTSPPDTQKRYINVWSFLADEFRFEATHRAEKAAFLLRIGLGRCGGRRGGRRDVGRRGRRVVFLVVRRRRRRTARRRDRWRTTTDRNRRRRRARRRRAHDAGASGRSIGNLDVFFKKVTFENLGAEQIIKTYRCVERFSIVVVGKSKTVDGIVALKDVEERLWVLVLETFVQLLLPLDRLVVERDELQMMLRAILNERNAAPLFRVLPCRTDTFVQTSDRACYQLQKKEKN